LDSFGSGYGPVAGCCEHGNEPTVSTVGGEFHEPLCRKIVTSHKDAVGEWRSPVVVLLTTPP
jgi:hypothetical protein